MLKTKSAVVFLLIALAWSFSSFYFIKESSARMLFTDAGDGGGGGGGAPPSEFCGDYVCQSWRGENCVNCLTDCRTCCGDGTCYAGETCTSCSLDCGTCPPVCGDEICQVSEGYDECSVDCPNPNCGDSICQMVENFTNCGPDCPVGCGDQVCQATENPTNCPYDCACGNGRINSGEQCDGSNLNGQTCISRGYDGGTLTCNGNCTFNVSQCFNDPVCGDESCNGAETCLSCVADCGTCPVVCGQYGCQAGESCSNCPVDCGPCAPYCGDGSCNGGESCASCSTDCGPCAPYCGDGSCNGSETCSSCPGDCGVCCGNGVINAGEQCDGTNLNGKTCATSGSVPPTCCGTLACRPNCQFDTTNCTSCGNNVVDYYEGSQLEDCDGTDLANSTCQLLGYTGGILGCSASCEFTTSNCYQCGNTIVEGPWEECDGVNNDGNSCLNLGYDWGLLQCDGNCSYSVDLCIYDPVCGDTICNAGLGETNSNCSTDCSPECVPTICQPTDCGLVTDGCGGQLDCGSCCGNNVFDPQQEENCDGGQLNGETCTSMGYIGGPLSCAADTCHFDVDSCEYCGDGVRQVGIGDVPAEDCDGSDLAGQSCVSLGFAGGGTLLCKENCTFSTNSCIPPTTYAQPFYFILFDPLNWPLYKANPYIDELDPPNVEAEMINGQNDEKKGVNPRTVNSQTLQFKVKKPGDTNFTDHFVEGTEYVKTPFRVPDIAPEMSVLEVRITPVINGNPISKIPGTYTIKVHSIDLSDEPFKIDATSGMRDFAMNRLDFIPNTQEIEEFVEISVTYIDDGSGNVVLNGIPTVKKIGAGEF